MQQSSEKNDIAQIRHILLLTLMKAVDKEKEMYIETVLRISNKLINSQVILRYKLSQSRFFRSWMGLC